MITIIGATGRVGSGIVRRLLARGEPVQAIARSSAGAAQLARLGATAVIADLFDADALKSAFEETDIAFLLMPENPTSDNVFHDALLMLEHYREAIQTTGIRRIVGLSSAGAQHDAGTGNLVISYMLEHAFQDLPVETTFIRPSYFYSNCTGYLDMARSSGIFPTFLPSDLKIPMIAPDDVAAFATEILTGERKPLPVYEITGPAAYSPEDIAQSLTRALKQPVTVSSVPTHEWIPRLLQIGFSPSAAEGLARMTSAVITGKTAFEQDPIRLATPFADYLRATLAVKT